MIAPSVWINHCLGKLIHKKRDEDVSSTAEEFHISTIPDFPNQRHLILLLCFVVISTGVSLSNYVSFKGQALPPSLDVNVECSPCSEERESYCEIDETYQFNSVIWFITDGWPWYLANETIKKYSDHMVPFTTALEGTRWSHTVYTTWFTGLPSTNLFGAPIKGDQVFEASQRASGLRCSLNGESVGTGQSGADLAKFTWHYIGPEWCPGTLLGGEEKMRETGFTDITFKKEEYKIMSVYNDFKRDDVLSQTFQKSADKNQSIVIHSGIFDKLGHKMEKNHDQARLPRERHFLSQLFEGQIIKTFIDSHPNYLLIMSSDHGMSPPNKEGAFHGDARAGSRGNVGWVAFYNPKLSPTNVTEIDAVDVLPTISKYLKGVDIPFFSTGEARNFYGNGNSGIKNRVNALKQNLVQLSKAAKYRSVSFDSDRIERLVAPNSVNLEEILQEVQSMKSKLYISQHPVHFFWLATFAISTIAILVFWMSRNGAFIRTFILSLPSLGLMGFTYYKFHKFFPYYFFTSWDVGYSLLVLIFSPRRFLQVVLNELLVGLAFGLVWLKFASGHDHFLVPFISYVSCFFIFAANTHKNYEQITFIYMNGILLSLLITFEATSSVEGLYFVGGFHVAVALLFVGLAACVWLFYSERNPAFLVLGLSSFLLLIQRGHIAIPILNLQFGYVVPKILSTTATEPQKGNFGYQAAIWYADSFIFWFYAATYGNLNFEVDINAGAVGVTNWNLYPSYSGAVMAFSKIGIVILAAIYFGVLVRSEFGLLPSTFQVSLTALVVHWSIAIFQRDLLLESALIMCVLFGLKASVAVVSHLRPDRTKLLP